jgi:hypothetical protein
MSPSAPFQMLTRTSRPKSLETPKAQVPFCLQCCRAGCPTEHLLTLSWLAQDSRKWLCNSCLHFIPALPTLGKTPTFQCLHFLIYKVGTVTVPNFQSYCKG